MVASSTEPARGPAARRAWGRLGGILAIAGGLGYVGGGAIHQDLPSGAAAALPHVAGRPEWPRIHRLVLVSVAVWPVAFAGIVASLRGVWSTVIGRIAVGAMLGGAVLFAVEMALDGYTLKWVADAWAQADGARHDELFIVGEAAYTALTGIFYTTMIWMSGAAFALLGLAIALSGTYPRWTGWVGAVLGLVVTFSAMSYYLGLHVVPHLAGHVIPAFLLALWLLAMGVLVLRRAPRME
jgi:hypothetical protein